MYNWVQNSKCPKKHPNDTDWQEKGSVHGKESLGKELVHPILDSRRDIVRLHVIDQLYAIIPYYTSMET
jgi:hypothetical protein